MASPQPTGCRGLLPWLTTAAAFRGPCPRAVSLEENRGGSTEALRSPWTQAAKVGQCCGDARAAP